MERKKDNNSASEPVPNRITLEILSSGTGSMEPSVIIRTPTKGYLINCPEATTRMLLSMSLKANNINDVLITSCDVRRTGGLSGVMFAQSKGGPHTRIHGPPFVRSYLGFLRQFVDDEFGEVRYPVTVIQQPLEGSFTDAAFKISCIPLEGGAMTGSGSGSNGEVFNVAFLLETAPVPRRIDMAKILAKKVPKGHFIGALKSGNPVTLEDGTVVKPEDVYADDFLEDSEDSGADSGSSVLILDVVCQNQIKFLDSSKILLPYLKKEKNINFIVHFTTPEIFKSQKYQQFCNFFDQKTTQIICNGTGKPDPHLESVYKHQIGHTALSKKFFPKLWPDFDSVLDADAEILRDEKGRILARPMQRHVIRGSSTSQTEACSIDLRVESNSAYQRVVNEGIKEKLDQNLRSLPVSHPEPYPKLIFLGTSSATPSKYRNVSSMLVQTKSNFYMVDAGEGTFVQLKQLFGDQIDHFLRNLTVIFLTHTHQDHTVGLVTVLQERKRAVSGSVLDENEKNPDQLVVVCNENILKHIHSYSARFYNVLSCAKFIVPVIQHDVHQKPVPVNISRMFADMDLTSSMPDLDVKAVRVNHTFDALGFVMILKKNNRKIVISGDTMPCDSLVLHGKNAHVLVHEATLEDGHEQEALRKKHSTMAQAVNVGKRMNAKHMILTHFSARYPKVPPLPDYLDKNNVSVAMDNLVVSMEDLDKLPKLNEAYRQLYEAELVKISTKAEQHTLKMNPQK